MPTYYNKLNPKFYALEQLRSEVTYPADTLIKDILQVWPETIANQVIQKDDLRFIDQTGLTLGSKFGITWDGGQTVYDSIPTTYMQFSRYVYVAGNKLRTFNGLSWDETDITISENAPVSPVYGSIYYKLSNKTLYTFNEYTGSLRTGGNTEYGNTATYTTRIAQATQGADPLQHENITLTLPSHAGTIALTTDIPNAALHINTISDATNVDRYITFVARNNATSLAEDIFTDGGMYYNPGLDRFSLTGHAVIPTIYGSLAANGNLTIRANYSDLTSGSVNFTNSLEASSTTVAAVTMAGGLGIAKKLYVGSDTSITGDLAVNGATSADITTTTLTATIFNGTATRLDLGGAATIVNIGSTANTAVVNINGTTPSTTAATGTLVVDGGLGVAGSIHAGGDLIIGTTGTDTTTKVTTHGTTDLVLNTNNGTNSGSIIIYDGADGNISITPNGTGKVQIDNIGIDGNTIYSTNSNGEIILDPNPVGNAGTVRIKGNFIVDGTETVLNSTTLNTNDKTLMLAAIDSISTDLEGDGLTGTISGRNLVLNTAVLTMTHGDTSQFTIGMSIGRSGGVTIPLSARIDSMTSTNILNLIADENFTTDGTLYFTASVTPTDFTADGSGIVVKASSDGLSDKTLTWEHDNITANTSSWVSSDNFAVESGKGYYIGTTNIFTSPTITTPYIDHIRASGDVATDLWSEVITNTITIGAGLTTGTLNIANTGTSQTGTVNIAATGTSVTNINIGHTNAITTIVAPTILDIKAPAIDSAADLWSEITTGTIAIGAEVTSGSINVGAKLTAGTLNLGTSTAFTTGKINIGTGAAGVKEVNVATGNSGTSVLNLGTGATAGTNSINIGTASSGANTVTIGTTAKTTLDANVASFALDSTSTSNITSTGADGTANTLTLAAGNNSSGNTQVSINATSTSGTGIIALTGKTEIDLIAPTIDIADYTGSVASTINIGSGATTGGKAVNIATNTSSGTNTINIGTGAASAATFALGTLGYTTLDINTGSTTIDGSTISIDGTSSSNFTVTEGTVGNDTTLTLKAENTAISGVSSASVDINAVRDTGGTGTASINLTATDSITATAPAINIGGILKTSSTANINGSFDTSATTPTGTTRLNYSGNLYANKFNALTLTAATNGFTIAGGTTSKTLTVSDSTTLATNAITFASAKSVTAQYASLTVGASTLTGDITLKSNGTYARSLTLGEAGVSEDFAIKTLTANHVLYASAANTIDSEAYLDISRGGTGAATAAGNTVFGSPFTNGANITVAYDNVIVATNTLHAISHGLGTAGTYVNLKYLSTTGAKIGGLTLGSVYYVKIVDIDNIEFVTLGVGTPLLSVGASGNHVFVPSLTSAPSFRKLANEDLPQSGVSAGTYSVVAVNAKGLVTGGGQLMEMGYYVSSAGETTNRPSAALAVGGLFFEAMQAVGA